MTKFGDFEVELDLESGCLVVVNKTMQYMLHIGGDTLNVLDLDNNWLDDLELPV